MLRDRVEYTGRFPERLILWTDGPQGTAPAGGRSLHGTARAPFAFCLSPIGSGAIGWGYGWWGCGLIGCLGQRVSPAAG